MRTLIIRLMDETVPGDELRGFLEQPGGEAMAFTSGTSLLDILGQLRGEGLGRADGAGSTPPTRGGPQDDTPS